MRACIAAVFSSLLLAAPASGETWSADELRLIASLRLDRLPPLRADPSNAYESNPQAIALGRRLFHDPRLSANGAISCATCHDPARGFQDGLPVGNGIASLARRTPSIVAAGHGAWLFWDGRKDSLWSQALAPLEDAREQGGTRTGYAHFLARHYRAEYETIFGKLPDLSRLPHAAGPLGSSEERAAWLAMNAVDRENVSRVFTNLGKAVAAWERTLRHGPSRFDRYAASLAAAAPDGEPILTAREREGLRIFIGKGRCVSCHNGPLFTDHYFHVTKVPWRDPAVPDRGREIATLPLREDEFNCLGRYSDARPEQCRELRFMVTLDPGLAGAFKTPGLRNVAQRAPYMHAGQFATLREVISHYAKAPGANLGPARLDYSQGVDSELKPLSLSEAETMALVAFLATLSGPVTESPDR